jgi:hypothetical protein
MTAIRGLAIALALVVATDSAPALAQAREPKVEKRVVRVERGVSAGPPLADTLEIRRVALSVGDTLKTRRIEGLRILRDTAWVTVRVSTQPRRVIRIELRGGVWTALGVTDARLR